MESNIPLVQNSTLPQTSTQQITPPIKKSLPKLPLIIAIILLISAIGLPLGSYLLFREIRINLQPSTITIKTITPMPTISTISPTPITGIPNTLGKISVTTLNPGSKDQWKTYTNTKYGFQVTYPAKGMIFDGNNRYPGICGNGIKYDPYFTPGNSYVDEILIDNFFGIRVVDWAQSIDNYVKQQDPNKFYNITPITADTNADEAIIVKIKPEIEQNDLGATDNITNINEPGFVLDYSIYKKGNKLFIIHGFQNLGNPGGCVSSSIDWDKSRSLRFTQ